MGLNLYTEKGDFINGKIRRYLLTSDTKYSHYSLQKWEFYHTYYSPIVELSFCRRWKQIFRWKTGDSSAAAFKGGRGTRMCSSVQDELSDLWHPACCGIIRAAGLPGQNRDRIGIEILDGFCNIISGHYRYWKGTHKTATAVSACNRDCVVQIR